LALAAYLLYKFALPVVTQRGVVSGRVGLTAVVSSSGRCGGRAVHSLLRAGRRDSSRNDRTRV
jgi:hypothetical protein